MVDSAEMIEEPKQGDGEREAKRFISDVVEMEEMVRGKLNLIFSPCGSGKTTFIETVLREYGKEWPNEILYLVPTRALRDAFNARGEKTTEVLWNGEEIEVMKQEGITAMTYAKFGSRVKAEKAKGKAESALWRHNAIICLDEMQQAVTQKDMTAEEDNLTKMALDELVVRSEDESNLVIAFSATPKKAITYMLDHFHWKSTGIHIVYSALALESYKAEREICYSRLEDIIEEIDSSQRGLIYIDSIRQIKSTVDRLKDRGINAVGIWSELNREKMTDAQVRVKRSLVKEEKIPDDVQVLIINAAYQTGLNIDPSKTHLDYIVVHNSNEDVQKQAMGRYRGDIDTAYLRVRDEFELSLSCEVVDKYRGRRLLKEDTDKLCEELNIRDKKGNLCKWPKVCRMLMKQGYEISSGKSGSTRYHKID